MCGGRTGRLEHCTWMRIYARGGAEGSDSADSLAYVIRWLDLEKPARFSPYIDRNDFRCGVYYKPRTPQITHSPPFMYLYSAYVMLAALFRVVH